MAGRPVQAPFRPGPAPAVLRYHPEVVAPETTQDLDPSASARRWARVRALVEEALSRPEAERAELVARHAGTDEALAAEALALLALDARDGGAGDDVLELPHERVLGARALRERPRLGPWRLLRQIGSGGMGAVYLGVRADGQFEKRVAIKLIKRGMDTDEVLRRFERERQVLASLDHPGIARLVDGGMSDDGRPYLVLEYVEGEPLDRWCDAQGLTVRERIELFRGICAAVDEAHRSLVVHRDLKPSNVLVDASGRPRLLDFGIAKVLDPRRGEATLDLTATPLRFLTPAYASPEQVRGAPITTASDVYSLGAILYQLLTGRQPLVFETGSAGEVERVVCERDPERPSQAVLAGPEAEALAERRRSSPRALSRALAGDLDTIVLTALRKEPRRRYASAADLSEDLRRYLRELPVQARGDSFGYRAAKYVRRNRLAASAGAAVLLALVAGLVASLWQYRRARAAGVELAEQLEVGRERNAELSRLNAELEEQRAAAAASLQLAQERAGALERLAADLGERSREAEEQRALAQRRHADVRDFATSIIYDLHRELVPLRGALAAKRLLVETGLRFLDQLRSEGDPDPALRRALAGGYLRLAEIQADDGSDTLGDSRAALESLDKAVAVATELHEEGLEELANDWTLGSALLQRADLLRMLGRHGEAHESYLRAARTCGADEERPSSSPGRSYVLAMALHGLGVAAAERGALDEARELGERSRALLEVLVRRLPGIALSLVETRVAEAQRLAAGGELVEAEDAYRAAIAAFEDHLRGDPQHAVAWRSLREAQLALGSLLLELEAAEEAGVLAADLVLSTADEARAAPEDFQLRRLSARAHELLAGAAALGGRPEEAAAAAEQAVARARDLVRQDPANAFVAHDLGRALLRLGLVELERGRLLDAEAALREATGRFEQLVALDPGSAFALRALRAAQGVLARAAWELAERAGAPAGERGRWLARARESYRAALATAERLEQASPALPADERARAELAEGSARCERAAQAEPPGS